MKYYRHDSPLAADGFGLRPVHRLCVSYNWIEKMSLNVISRWLPAGVSLSMTAGGQWRVEVLSEPPYRSAVAGQPTRRGFGRHWWRPWQCDSRRPPTSVPVLSRRWQSSKLFREARHLFFATAQKYCTERRKALTSISAFGIMINCWYSLLLVTVTYDTIK